MNIILSCTTTSERTGLFYYGIQSLLKQTLKPDIFLVNISHKTNLQESGFSEIPEWLNKKSVKVNWIKDIGPYGKLLPAIEYTEENDVIITVDDDVIYSESIIEDLVSRYKENPKNIVCSRAKRMRKNLFDKWENYRNWGLIEKKCTGNKILPTGVGGVVYNKKLLDLEFLFDKKFLEIAPTTDDLWFRMASLRKNTPVSVFPEVNFKNKLIRHYQGLEEKNLSRRKNKSNRVIKNIKYFNSKIFDYLGMNRSVNDRSWKQICHYSNNK